MNQSEPDYCAEARIIDAASWMVKAAAQFSTIDDVRCRKLADGLEEFAKWSLALFQEMAKGGSVVAEDAHVLMIRHALLNACGHAWYVKSPAAVQLMEEYLKHTRERK